MSSVAVVPSTQELVLGRYRPVRPLGSGGSGSVWLALDEQNGLDVALKIIPREGKGGRARRARGARRTPPASRPLRARLRRRARLRATSTSRTSTSPAERCARRFAPARSPISDAVEVAAQVLDALAHAHRAGIVHRDVKPANILLEDRDEIAVRLLDFGLAQFDGADTLTAVGDVPGTLAYIAPERLAGGDATPAERRVVRRRPPLGDPHRPAPVLGHADPGGRTRDPGRRASARVRAPRPSAPTRDRRRHGARDRPERRARARPTSPRSCGIAATQAAGSRDARRSRTVEPEESARAGAAPRAPRRCPSHSAS